MTVDHTCISLHGLAFLDSMEGAFQLFAERNRKLIPDWHTLKKGPNMDTSACGVRRHTQNVRSE